MLKVINVKEYEGGLDKAISYIHGKWGNEKNYPFYKDAIYNSFLEEKKIPKFFLLLKDNEIIGFSALIINDFISRHDLYPWLACLFVEKKERGNGYGNVLMEHIEKEAREMGFSVGYYEKYGWTRIEDGIDLFSCKPTRIYKKVL